LEALQSPVQLGAGGSQGNPSYSGGRDQEDSSLKPSQTKSSRALISKNPSQHRAGGVVQDVGPEFKPQYCKTKTKQTTTKP
jgi:hypothetical protein